MRVALQRVSKASVIVDNTEVSAISQGLLLLLGVEEADTNDDIAWLVKKITQMRIFNDDQGKMNLSLLDIEAELLVVSQFTLHASTKKGNRPSFIKAAKPEHAKQLYEAFISSAKQYCTTRAGVFGADMQLDFINSGPVTILLDSKNKE